MIDYSTAPKDIDRVYAASPNRYSDKSWRPMGLSGLKTSRITLGTWQNFSDLDPRESVRSLYLTAFDQGIFAFDFGNNYGRPPGSAEALFGSFLQEEFRPYRREMVISTKAGYDMWPGPNGVGSSAKYLISSLDESLKRLKLDYVDVFYSHRYDPTTPLEETAEALDIIRRSGRCLYVGISSYPTQAAAEIAELLQQKGTPLIVNQSHYNMLCRWTEEEVQPLSERAGTGFAAFSPLAQGLLSEKYINDLGGRGALPNTTVYCNDWDKLRLALSGLHTLAQQRGQTISQMALSWVLRSDVVCTAVIGVRTVEQLLACVKLNTQFSQDEEREIEALTRGIDVDLWNGTSDAASRNLVDR